MRGGGGARGRGLARGSRGGHRRRSCRGFVEELLKRGARRVYATGRNPKNLPEIVALDPQRVVPLTLDVTSDAQRRAAAEAARDVTLLINNAAYPGSETAEQRRVLSVGAFFCLPEFSSYSISKAAAAIMTGGLRAETDRQPVLVSQVVTGSVLTRASPVGTKSGFTPVQHAEEVFDALAQGETEILAAGSKGFFERLRADPKAFERGVIDRFHDNPVKIAPYEG